MCMVCSVLNVCLENDWTWPYTRMPWLRRKWEMNGGNGLRTIFTLLNASKQIRYKLMHVHHFSHMEIFGLSLVDRRELISPLSNYSAVYYLPTRVKASLSVTLYRFWQETHRFSIDFRCYCVKHTLAYEHNQKSEFQYFQESAWMSASLHCTSYMHLHTHTHTSRTRHFWLKIWCEHWKQYDYNFIYLSMKVRCLSNTLLTYDTLTHCVTITSCHIFYALYCHHRFH